MSTFEHISSESFLLDDSLRAQLRDILQKISREVYLVSIVDETNEKSMELAVLLKDIGTLCDKLHLEFYAPLENVKRQEELSPEGRLPVVGIYDEVHRFTGIVFYGVPGGRELNSFVIALYNVGGQGQAIEGKARKAVEKIDTETDIQVFISLSCHHCAQIVMAAQQIAAMNPLVQAKMIDANLFPDLVEKYQIERVPITILNNNSRIIGAKTVEELAKMINKL